MEKLRTGVESRCQRLKSIAERLELIPEPGGVALPTVSQPRAHTNRVFLVHGHDEAARKTVARFLEKLSVEAIILHEQASGGRTIVEKLEHYADTDFAVVLLTPDDVGEACERAGALQPRARQNVVLELGFFIGRLGRKHVCALYKGPLELPSDFIRVVFVPFDGAGGWRLQLAKEMRESGFAVDMNLAI